MALLEHLATKQVIVMRLSTVSGYRSAYATTTAAMAEIQPAADAKGSIGDGTYGKGFTGYADVSHDIREGDRLREVATGTVYEVRTGGVSRRTMGSIDYLKLSLNQVS